MKRIAAVTAGAAALLAVVYGLNANPAHRAAAPVAPEAARAGPVVQAPAATAALPHGPAESSGLPEDETDLVAHLRSTYGPRMHDKHAQVRLIEKLLRYLQQRYPDDWRERLPALLRTLFPEIADALIARAGQLERHTRWLEENRRSLNGMTAAQRRDVMWAARREAFGAEADEIWAGQLRAERLEDALAEIDAAGNQTVAQRLDRFVDAVEQAYGEQAPQFMEQRRTELLGSFLELPKVQEELRALPAAERRDALRSVRAGLGLDGAALDRWDELDRTRDSSWDAGQRYMAERGGVLAVGAPGSQDRQLDDLRQRIFGPELAGVLAEEEAAGFLRYAQPRRIGRE